MVKEKRPIVKTKPRHVSFTRPWLTFKMYQPRTISEAIVPLILANTILGMGNFAFCVDHVRRVLSFAYATCCAVGFSVVTKISMTYLDRSYLNKATSLGNDTCKGLFLGNSFVTVCLIVTGWFKAKDIEATIERIEACDQTMEKMGIRRSYEKLFLYQLYSFGLIGLIIIGFVTVNYNWLFSQETPINIKLILTFTMHLPVVLIGISDASFCFWVRYTRLKFQQLNDLLRGMLTTTPESPQHKRVLAMKYDIVNKDLSSLRDDRSRESNDNAETMKAVKQIHLELVKSARNTNNMYGIQILLTMTTSFILITGLLYDAYTILWLDISTYLFFREIVPVGCWIAFYAFKIFVVNHACAKACNEESSTGDIICELYEPSTSREFRAEIRDFTLQLIQNPLTFTACGFFDLDHTFIQGVIGSITTYLVILIQVGDIPTPSNYTNTTNTTTQRP